MEDITFSKNRNYVGALQGWVVEIHFVKETGLLQDQLAPEVSNAGYSIFEIVSMLVGSFFLRFLLFLKIFLLIV